MKAGKDYIGVGVGGMIFNAAGQVFLSQRGAKATNERGCWEFPGGKVDFGETMIAALKREFMEEYGMTIEIDEFLAVEDHILPDEGQHWISPSFIGHWVSGEPCILELEKITAIGWFSLDDLPQPLSVISQADVRNYQKKARG